MNAGDVITLFRRNVEDPTFYADNNLPQANTLWSDYELLNWLNLLQVEFSERTLVLKDATNFLVDVTADDPEVLFDPRIIRVDRAELMSTNIPLKLSTLEEFNLGLRTDDYGVRHAGSFENEAGVPRHLITDLDTNLMRAYPIPTEDDVIKLTVRRRPLEVISAKIDEFEVPERYHINFVDGLTARALSTPKAMLNGFDQMAEVFSAKWESVLLRAAARIKIRTRGPGKTRYGGL